MPTFFYVRLESMQYVRKRKRERDVGIICVIIYDDLALEAWTQRRERERERKRVCERKKRASERRGIRR